MGSFTCNCDFVIRDSPYPNPCAGDLYWQPEEEAASQRFLNDVRAFLAASARGDRIQWLLTHFAPEYPIDIDDADVIDDIRTAAFSESGRPVYKCPQCSRLYLRLMDYDNKWTPYDPAE
jgi:hypothetical protein